MDLTQIIALQKKRMSVGNNGATDDMDKTLFHNFESNPAYRVVEINGEEVGVHFIDNGNTGDIPSRYAICKPPFEFSAGDVIKVNEGEYWICTVVNDLMYNKSFFIPCNMNLKFINENDELITKWCRVSAQTLYTTGVKEGKLITMPDGMQGIQLPFDEDTKKLDRDSLFVFNKSRYKTTFYDEVSYPGILILICQEVTIFDVSDDLENEIANRYREDGSDRLAEDVPIEPEMPVDPSEDNYAIEIMGEDRFGLMTESTYTAKVLNNGIEVADKEVVFLISNDLAIIKSQINNICILKTNTKFKTGSFTLKAELIDENEIFKEKDIIITGL